MANRFGGAGIPAGVLLVPIAGSSKFLTTGAATVIQSDMSTTGTYVYTCDVDTYIRQSAAGTAATAANASMLVAAGCPVLIDGAQGAQLSVLQKSGTGGAATLQKMTAILS